MKKIIILLMALVLVFSVAGCSNATPKEVQESESGENINAPAEDEPADAQDAGEVLRLGLACPVTGNSAYAGSVVENAVRMAVDEINAQGGIAGKYQIELLVEDNENEPSVSVSAVEKLVNQDKADVVISGTNSSCVLADMMISQQAGVPELAPASTSPTLTQQGNSYFFRTAPTDIVNCKTLLKHMSEQGGISSIAVLYRTDDFGMNGFALTEEYVSDYGITIKESATFSAEDVDFSVQLTSLNESGADALFIWGQYTEVTLMCKQMDQYAVDMPVYCVGCNSPQLVEMGGEYVEDIIFSASFSDANPDEDVQAFNTKYLERNSEGYDQNAPQAYDTVYIIAEAIERAGSLDKEAIREALAQTDFDGVTGHLTFDENGECQKDVLVVQVQNGKHVILN